jgi:hypothetical protein
MKALTFALTAALCLPPRASSECVVVPAVYQPSSQNAEITVFLEGKPHGNVKLRVFTFDGHLRLSVFGDSKGIVKLPHLPAGKYCLTANAAPNLGASMCLDLSVRDSGLPKTFSMNLGYEHGVSTNLDYILDRAEEKAATERLQKFAGTVLDPSGSGAAIPHALVFVARHGSHHKAHPLKITADQDGHFSAQLHPGTYTAVFEFPAFVTEVVIFEIAPDGSQEGLRVTLQIRRC